jgi:RimJ/RimL family protein N-acetyltransferase
MDRRPGPAYAIRCERLLLRCWEPGPRDAGLLRAAIAESLEHLRPWMPWARYEPETAEEKIGRMRAYRKGFVARRELVYGIFSADGERVLGGCGLHDRVGYGALEIGYWVHVDFLRRGYASETAAALTRVGFELEGVERIEIQCDPRNRASAGVPRKLGYRHRETRRGDEVDPEGRPRDTMVWVLDRESYPRSAAAGSAVEAFDESGTRLELAARGAESAQESMP